MSQPTKNAYETSLAFFLAPLMPLFERPEISEIMVNGPHQVYVEKGGKLEQTPIRFESELALQAAARNIAQFIGQDLTQERPLIDGRLPDGSRVTIVLAPLASTGTQINIRRFSRAALSAEFLLEQKTLTPMALEFLTLAIHAHQNILVSGGAGSGKTTLVNLLAQAFGPQERILIIEDTRELQINRPHIVQMEARPADPYGRGQVSVRDLFITALRMRPDRIVVGEVRRGEALDLIQALTSGHRGSLATMHASTAADTCRRLETMALMADVAIPLMALRRQVASALDLVIQATRLSSGRRMVTQISEIDFDEKAENYIIRDVFRVDVRNPVPTLIWTGLKPRLLESLALEGLTEQLQECRPMLQGEV